MKLTILLLTIAVCGLLTAEDAHAETPLELIEVFHSDSVGGRLARGCMSPGDIDGDGYSEIFVAEYAGEKRIHAFSGGNPPNTFPDMLFYDYGGTHFWVPDINGDGIEDFAFLESYDTDVDVIQIWFGGEDFLSKSEPDLLLHQARDTVSYFGHSISSGDVNRDGQNDLIISAIHGWIGTYDGRFYIYYGGDILDTIADDVINFHNQDNVRDCFFVGTSPGDLNGDGLSDYVWTSSNQTNPSYAAVMYGRIPLDSVPDYTLWYHREDSDHFGESIHPLGDINKDGLDDFGICGQLIWPCIYFGGEPMDTMPLLLGDTTDTRTIGTIVSNVGDLNHDGWDDLAVGYPSLDLGSGIVYVYFGSRNIDTEADLVFHHSDVWPLVGLDFGKNLGPAGDFNGDGVDDLVISAEGDNALKWAKGNVYVYAGDSSLPTDADDPVELSLPQNFNILHQNYPNPFNSGTRIEYELSGIARRNVRIDIYNVLGQTVRTLIDTEQTGGSHVVHWDGCDDVGDAVPSGVYFYRLSTPSEVVSKKMLYLK